jgi:hypothetical protein
VTMSSTSTHRILAGGDTLLSIAPSAFTRITDTHRSALVWGVDLRAAANMRESMKRLDWTVRDLENLMCTISDVKRLFILTETRRGLRPRAVQRVASRLALRTTEAVRRRTGRSLEVVMIDVTSCADPHALQATVVDALEHHVSNGAYPDIACHWQDLEGRTICQLVQERHS